MAEKKMTVTDALAALKLASIAAEFLERRQQDIVNANAGIIVDMVEAKEDVDGATFSTSWKVKANTTKFGKACVKMVAVAEAHLAYEAKHKAIPTDVIHVKKELVKA